VMVVDACVRRLYPGRTFDEGGKLAAAGHVLDAVVAASLANPFFATEPPRSTGRELFGEEYAEEFIEQCLALTKALPDVVATATALTARGIAAAARFLPAPPRDVVRSGGGTRNPALTAMLEAAWPDAEHRDFDELFFDGDAKEAVAFAYLGYLTWTGRPGNEPGATGAAGPRVLGSITPA